MLPEELEFVPDGYFAERAGVDILNTFLAVGHVAAREDSSRGFSVHTNDAQTVVFSISSIGLDLIVDLAGQIGCFSLFFAESQLVCIMLGLQFVSQSVNFLDQMSILFPENLHFPQPLIIHIIKLIFLVLRNIQFLPYHHPLFHLLFHLHHSLLILLQQPTHLLPFLIQLFLQLRYLVILKLILVYLLFHLSLQHGDYFGILGFFSLILVDEGLVLTESSFHLLQFYLVIIVKGKQMIHLFLHLGVLLFGLRDLLGVFLMVLVHHYYQELVSLLQFQDTGQTTQIGHYLARIC